jgi:hypothetical protein
MRKKFLYLFFIFIILINNGFCAEAFIVEISIKNHKFEPSEITVPQNTKIKLIIHNLDESVEEFESFDLKREKIVPAGGQINIILAPLEPGKYHFFGDFHPETANGYLIVQ